MELKILNKSEEALLARTKVESEVLFDKSTPSNKDIKSQLAKMLNKDEKLLDIKHIYTSFGMKKAKILCYAYKDEDTLNKVKTKARKANKAATAPSTEAAKPAEEKKA